MLIVFIYGPPASGKHTVGTLVSERTGLPLFHNHLVVDAVSALFPFGSQKFVDLRHAFWTQAIQAACEEKRSFIFTFQPESSVSSDFPQSVVEAAKEADATVLFVHLKASREAQDNRLDNASRHKFGKLTDRALLARLQPEFEACEAAMPSADIIIDTDQVNPDEAADAIVHAVRPEN